jgi:glutamate---cysteine ligase / carboxylate-amine ligase
MTDSLQEYFTEVEHRFASSTDFTVGMEEEFQLIDPAHHHLINRFEELQGAAGGDLAAAIAGELISSEIEVRTPRSETFIEAATRLAELRESLFRLTHLHGVALGATGTHPFSSWKDQRIIDTPHYRAVEDTLKYVAWRNNTWSCHLHVGVRGPDRAIALCDALRGYLPQLLALSANSPFIEDVNTELHSARAQTFIRMFPRCGVPDVLGTWAEHRRFYEALIETNCIREFTQVWWSVRPHHAYGTVEIRICDAQTELWQTLAVMSLAMALLAELAWQYDEGRLLPVLETRYIEENLWRAIRHGLDGDLVDFRKLREVPAADAVREMVEFSAPAAERLGLRPFVANVEHMLRSGNGAQCQLRAVREGQNMRDVYAGTVHRLRDEVRLPLRRCIAAGGRQ